MQEMLTLKADIVSQQVHTQLYQSFQLVMQKKKKKKNVHKLETKQ